jgi:molybdenum cofactor cytidylyltransferase
MTGATRRFSAVVLAAGISERMQGRHKLLLPAGGEPVIRRTVRAVLGARPQEVVVVTGFGAEAVGQALAGLAIRLQANARYREGQMTSVAAGLGALTQTADAVLVCLGDMVLLTSADYRELVESHARHPDKSILVPQFNGQRGNPVVIAHSHLAQILSGQRNLGCRRLIADHPEQVHAHQAEHDRFVIDLDTPEDYVRVLRRLESAAPVAMEPGA